MCVSCSRAAPVATTEQAILGGEPDTAHGAVVALRQFDGQELLCSGTVFSVDPAHGRASILTAAHCLNGHLPALVIAGDDYAAADARRYVPSDGHIHPGYSSQADSANDVAVIRIVGDVSQLPSLTVAGPEETRPAVGDRITAVGYGLTSIDGGASSTVRRSAELVVSVADADEIRIDQADGRGICLGDSGGPLLVTSESGEERVVGVHSRLEPQSETSPPCLGMSVSTRVTGMRDFLADALAADEPPACALCRSRVQSEGGSCLAERRDCETRSGCAAVASCLDHCSNAVCRRQCMQNAPASEAVTLGVLIACPCTACAAECPATDACSGPDEETPPPVPDAGSAAPGMAEPEVQPRSEPSGGCALGAAGLPQRADSKSPSFAACAALGLAALARRITRTRLAARVRGGAKTTRKATAADSL